jgi:hypothetical protein
VDDIEEVLRGGDGGKVNGEEEEEGKVGEVEVWQGWATGASEAWAGAVLCAVEGETGAVEAVARLAEGGPVVMSGEGGGEGGLTLTLWFAVAVLGVQELLVAPSLLVLLLHGGPPAVAAALQRAVSILRELVAMPLGFVLDPPWIPVVVDAELEGGVLQRVGHVAHGRDLLERHLR